MDRITLPPLSLRWIRYSMVLPSVAAGVALAAVLAAAGAYQAALVVLYPFVILSAVLGGTGPGLLSVLLFALIALPWLRIHPYAIDPVSWATFIVGGTLGAAVTARLRRAGGRAGRSAAELQASFDTLQQPVILFDLSGHTTRANAAAVRLMGIDRLPMEADEYERRVLARRPRRVDGTPIGADALLSRRALAERGSHAGEFLLDNSDGQERVFEIFGGPLWDRGCVVGAVAVLHDITDRKRAEGALRASIQRLDAHMANTPLAVVEFDANVRVSRWSAGAERLWGWRADEVVGRAIDELRWVHEDDVERVRQLSAQMLNGQRRQNAHSNRNYCKDGTVVHCEWYNSAIYDEAGKLASILSLVLDVTERERHEEELARASAAKDQFLAMLSHELRNPLTPALAAAGALAADPRLPDDAREDALMIRRNIQLETRLIEDLLDVTRIARGKLSLRFEPVNLSRVLQHSVELCSADARAKGLTLKVETGTPGLVLHGDPARLQQLFWNLLKNAIKFTGEGGRIDLAVHRADGDRVVVRVRDSGEGIDPKHLPRIFEPFEQPEPAHPGARVGLGLGLAICREVVRLHGGQIAAHSEGKGRGATFTVELPLGHEEFLAPDLGAGGHQTAPPAMPAMHAPAGVEPARAAGASIRVLLVEDDPDTARLMSQMLRMRGYDLALAGGIRTATELARENDYDVLVSDLGLSDGTGLDLRRQLQGIEGLRSIAVSGFGSGTDVERSRDAGFDEHLVKPIDFPALEAAIQRLVGRSPQRTGADHSLPAWLDEPMSAPTASTTTTTSSSTQSR